MRSFSMLLIATVICWSLGCKKGGVSLSPLASLTITNVIGTGKTVKLAGTGDSVIAYATKALSLNAAENSKPLYIYPAGDSLHPYFDFSNHFENGGLYSLFLFPADPNNHVSGYTMVRDTLPYYTDTLFGVRFINLAVNMPPITIKLSSSPTISEHSNIAFGSLTAFKSYPGKSGITSTTFQIRDAQQDTIITSYTLSPIPRFFNCTLVWKGIKGGSGSAAPSILRVNNY